MKRSIDLRATCETISRESLEVKTVICVGDKNHSMVTRKKHKCVNLVEKKTKKRWSMILTKSERKDREQETCEMTLEIPNSGVRDRRRPSTPIQTIRIVMFGSGSVGKTSLVHRFLFNKFDTSYTATIEDDYRQVITYNNHIVDVTVLDTAGSYQFPAMRRHAIQHGHGFVLVYAVDNKSSLDEALRLYTEIKEMKRSDSFPLILVGNKIDETSVGKREIMRRDVDSIVDSWGYNAEHIETSAKSNFNVALVFNKLIGIIDEKNIENLEHGGHHSSSVSLARLTLRRPRSYSIDLSLDVRTKPKEKKKKLFLRKLFSRKTIRH